MRTDEFDYDLPDGAIAQRPNPQRDAARLLVDLGPDVAPANHSVADLPGLLNPGDLLVVNSTRVLPARLRLRKPSGGAAEVLLVACVDGDPTRWTAMVRPGRRLPPGTVLTPVVPDSDPPDPAAGRWDDVEVEVGEEAAPGQRFVRFRGVDDPLAALAALGEVPLPPYIRAPLEDPERYQTVYADRSTSVAAPTAGLHLTPEVLDRCADRGVQLAHVELDIGPGTFVPVGTDDIEDHQMHAERYRVPEGAIEAIASVRACGGSVVAVGTTVVRALESWAARDEPEGSTDLFITPGFEFALVDRLMTNFHQPRSTLLVLLEAFMGRRWRDLYATALDDGYRFLSFGDAMLVNRDG